MDTKNRLVVAKGKRTGEEMEWAVEVRGYKFLYTEWMNNKALLYSTGDSSQYPGLDRKGKEYGKGRASV